MKDYKERLKICKLMGLDLVPKHDPQAIERLSGMLAGKIKSEQVDAVELVRQVRDDE